MGAGGGAGGACCASVHRVHLVQVVRLFGVVLPFVACSLFLSSFSLCPWCIVLEYALISRFKGVFSGFYGVRVGLCCLGALRGLWGFCVREWLGGFVACGVFAFLFVSLPLFLSFLPLFYLFAYLQGFAFVVLVLSAFLLCFCVFFFPCGLYAKRKGAKVLPCVLACLVVGCFIWLLLCTPRIRQDSSR